ncbi:MAG: efflux RND transporter periplasmic adaptor subunit [Chitinophagales bacterium]
MEKVSAQQVQAVVIRSSSLENSINATGTVIANEEVEIRSEIQGRITGIYFNEGQYIPKNKLLIKIDDSELKAQQKKTELSIELAKDDEARKKKLFEISAISKEEFDVAINTRLKLEADKQLIDAQLLKTSIYAPFSGVIGLRYVSEGGYVSPANLISTLQQADPVKIEFSVPEKYADKLKNGAAVDFNVEGNTKDFTAKIYAREPKIDPATRTVKVRATCANPGYVLTPGAFAKLKISLGATNEAMVVPSEALIPTINGESVMIVKNGKAVLQIVTTGLRSENKTQIIDGVAPGDTLIVTGLLTVRNGMPVQPVLIDLSTENK